ERQEDKAGDERDRDEQQRLVGERAEAAPERRERPRRDRAFHQPGGRGAPGAGAGGGGTARGPGGGGTARGPGGGGTARGPGGGAPRAGGAFGAGVVASSRLVSGGRLWYSCHLRRMSFFVSGGSAFIAL